MARESETGKDAKAEPSVEDLSRQVEALRADLLGTAETLKALGLSQGQAMADDLRARADRLRHEGEERMARMQKQAEGLASEADKMVRDQPAMAMGMAAGFGFLIGLLLARK
jgi:ElaB/YqjD/DUF883 family membrane-anchored ribosome-binding protein